MCGCQRCAQIVCLEALQPALCHAAMAVLLFMNARDRHVVYNDRIAMWTRICFTMYSIEIFLLNDYTTSMNKPTMSQCDQNFYCEGRSHRACIVL